MSTPRCLVIGPVELGYLRAWKLQRGLLEARARGDTPDILLMVVHPPTITLGRRTDPANLLVDPARLAREGVTVHEVDRGGDITYHGPGQITGYPILDLEHHGKDVHVYLRRLEEMLIHVLAGYDLVGERIPGLTGVWVDDAKVAALGVKLRSWITMHGFALNVTTDLDAYRWIIPCGIPDKPVTSLTRLLGDDPGLEQVAARVREAFLDEFSLLGEDVDLEKLEALAEDPEEVPAAT